MKKVLVFGTFDGVHEGHRAMLREAKLLGTYLIVAVAPDAIVKETKGTLPKYSSAQRISMIKNERLADDVVIADSEMHSWRIVKKYKPDIVALGYDQDELKASLEEYLENSVKKPTIVVLKAHQPDKFKSSLMNK